MVRWAFFVWGCITIGPEGLCLQSADTRSRPAIRIRRAIGRAGLRAGKMGRCVHGVITTAGLAQQPIAELTDFWIMLPV